MDWFLQVVDAVFEIFNNRFQSIQPGTLWVGYLGWFGYESVEVNHAQVVQNVPFRMLVGYFQTLFQLLNRKLEILDITLQSVRCPQTELEITQIGLSKDLPMFI